MNDLRERNISLNVRKNGNLLSQLRLIIIPKKEAIVEILQGEGEGERYRILAREKTLIRLLFQLGGEGIYSIVVNRKVGRRMRRDIKKQRGLRRFGKWLIDTGVFRRIKSEEMSDNIMVLDDEIITIPSSSLFSKYFKPSLPVGDSHEFR